MIFEIVIPVLDQTTSEARLLNWLKREGQAVKRGEVVCEIETEKATVEVESPGDGILRKMLIEPGTTIPPLTVVGLVGGADEPLPQTDPFYRTQPAAPAPTTRPAAAAPAPASPRREQAGRVAASPRAKRLAEERGLDLAAITGTGPQGRIQEDDVRRALEAAPVRPPDAAARAAQATAQRVAESWATIPHFYTSITVDMSRVVSRQAELGAAYTYTDFIALAIGRALALFPALNGVWRDGGHQIAPEVHLGLVVHTPRGLVIATLRDLQKHTLESFAPTRAVLVQQARDGKLSAAAMSGATFSLSNLGPGHIDHFTAIISPPQVAIVSVGSILPRPVVTAAGDIVARPTATFTLGVDHRAIDGRAAAGFLEALKTALEEA
jgi:pyruvate dehydrogenase E2 component (dihydrolipoamide acetyltransferase)